MDETCVVWGEKCGETTNCLVYDIDKMRVYMAIFPAISIAIAFIFDICVWYHAKDLQIYDEGQQKFELNH
jgi:organic anion transporter 5A